MTHEVPDAVHAGGAEEPDDAPTATRGQDGATSFGVVAPAKIQS